MERDILIAVNEKSLLFNTGIAQIAEKNFSDREKKALIAFLHTLTDETFLADEKFSDPFQ